MFAVIAILCFLLALLDVELLSESKLLLLGLMFIALHLLIPIWPSGAVNLSRKNE
jgi:hypothetical protein